MSALPSVIFRQINELSEEYLTIDFAAFSAAFINVLQITIYTHQQYIYRYSNNKLLSILKQKSTTRRLLAVLFIICLITPAILLSADRDIQRVRPGQVIKITVAGHPEFTTAVVVRQDGTTEYPLLVGIPLDGLSATDIRDLLIPLLMRYEREPDVFVIISELQVVKTQVFGAVENPGRIETEGPLNIQQLLRMAGGPTKDADVAKIRIIRTTLESRREQIIDLTAYFKGDTLAIAPDVLDGDVIIVPVTASKDMIRIIGAVNAPGLFVYQSDSNLLDFIYIAGGLESNADSKRIILISQQNGKVIQKKYNLQTILKSGNTRELPPLIPGDIVIVPQKERWREFGFWVTFIYNLTLLTSSIVIISSL